MVDAEERDRQEKLGIVLVNLNAASEKDVFGSANSKTYAKYKQRQMPDLLVVHRPEDEAARHPFVWYNPVSWFTYGPRVSPIVWDKTTSPSQAQQQQQQPGAAAVVGGAEGQPQELKKPKAEAMTQTVEGEGADAAAAAAAAEVDMTGIDGALAAAQKASSNSSNKRRLKSGLPAVVMEPLSDKFVRRHLTDAVVEDRNKIIKGEAAIHATLDAIEQTRFKYLVPSPELQCEREVARVHQCYETKNKEAAVARHVLAKEAEEREALRAQGVPLGDTYLSTGGSAGGMHELFPNTPCVMSHVLDCFPAVESLRVCAEAVVQKYSEGEAKLA